MCVYVCVCVCARVHVCVCVCVCVLRRSDVEASFTVSQVTGRTVDSSTVSASGMPVNRMTAMAAVAAGLFQPSDALTPNKRMVRWRLCACVCECAPWAVALVV